MNWENLKNQKCPNCNCKLHCRIKGSAFKIKSRKGNLTKKDESWYFCSRCEGFQISEKKLVKLITKKPIKLGEVPKKDRHLFKNGLLSL